MLSTALLGQTITAEPRWISYHGGIEDDQVCSMATDEFGHVYITGRTTAGILLGNDTTDQSGLTHQAEFGGGGSDAFLAKIAPHGSVLWCTYFGGAGEDAAVQVVITGMDGVFIIGNTTSPEAIATDTLSYQNTIGGGSDIFIARFTDFGLLTGATYFGGIGDEFAAGGALDVHGRLLVVGSSSGSETFSGITPVQPYSGGIDGLLLTFQGTDSLVAGTFVGGEGDDPLIGIAYGDSTGAVIAGNTTSSTGIAIAGAITPSAQGGTDGYLLKLDTLLAVVSGTYFGGVEDDRILTIARAGQDHVIGGISYSDSLYTDSLSHQPFNGGAGDGFIAFIDSLLQIPRCTFVGDTGQDRVSALTIDKLGRAYASGITGSAQGISTATGQGSELAGQADGFLICFAGDRTFSWSRYLGAMGEDEALALTIAGHTSLFIGGRTNSVEDLVVLGHQMDHGGGEWDGFSARLDQAISTECTGICTGTSTGYGNCTGVTPPLDQFDVCLGDSITFIVYGGALGMQAEWMWYADGCGIPEQFLTSGDTITIAPTSSFILSVRAESLHGVTSCRSLPIIVHTFPDPIVNVDDTVCAGSELQLEGSGAEQFAWSLGDTILAGPTVLATAPLAAGELLVEVTATNGPSCSVMIDVPIEVLPLPEAAWIVTDITCNGGADGSITLDTVITPDLTITWYQPGFEGNTLLDLQAGSYSCTVMGSNGCTRIDSLVIEMPPPLIDSVATMDAACGTASGSAQLFSLSNTPGLAFDWGDGPGSITSIQDLLPGNYSVLASDSSGCIQQMDFSIASIGLIDVQIDADTILAIDGSAILQSSTVPYDSTATFLWSPATGLDDPSASITDCSITEPITYVVQAISSAGCIATDTVVVIPLYVPDPIITAPCGEAFLPDIFSPNSDGLNDRLCLLGGCFTSIDLNICDRWGKRIFSSDADDLCWDGTLAGTLLPAGSYAFTLYAERTGGDIIERTGTITLKR